MVLKGSLLDVVEILDSDLADINGRSNVFQKLELSRGHFPDKITDWTENICINLASIVNQQSYSTHHKLPIS